MWYLPTTIGNYDQDALQEGKTNGIYKSLTRTNGNYHHYRMQHK